MLMIASHAGTNPTTGGPVIAYSRYLGSFWDAVGRAYGADAPFTRLPAIDFPTGVGPGQVEFVGAHLITTANFVYKSSGSDVAWSGPDFFPNGDIIAYSRYLGCVWNPEGLAFSANVPFDARPAVDLPSEMVAGEVAFVGAALILTSGAVYSTDCSSTPWVFEGVFEGPISGVGDASLLPGKIGLLSVFPNPFNPRTTVWLDIPRTGGVTLAVHDLRGRLVRTLMSGQMNEGRHPVVWDGLDDRGAQAPSGVYLVRLVTSDGAQRAVKVTIAK